MRGWRTYLANNIPKGSIVINLTEDKEDTYITYHHYKSRNELRADSITLEKTPAIKVFKYLERCNFLTVADTLKAKILVKNEFDIKRVFYFLEKKKEGTIFLIKESIFEPVYKLGCFYYFEDQKAEVHLIQLILRVMDSSNFKTIKHELAVTEFLKLEPTKFYKLWTEYPVYFALLETSYPNLYTSLKNHAERGLHDTTATN